jgi:peroxiredoxin
MLDFWASWYPDWRRETPKIKEAFARFSKEGRNVVAVDTAGRDNVEAVKAYIHAHGLACPVYYDAGLAAAKAYVPKSALAAIRAPGTVTLPEPLTV